MSSLAPQLSDYPIDRELSRDQPTFLATDPRGKQVVLKRIPEDCILGGQLHPAIKQRLAHVRDLADMDVATLHGVVRSDCTDDSTDVWLVWDFIAGKPVDATIERLAAERSLTSLRRLLREIVLAVESLHARGIVHGALRAGNVIVDETGRVRLTQISPLLYEDPRDDQLALIRLLATQAARAQLTALARQIERAEFHDRPLAWLRTELAGADTDTLGGDDEENANTTTIAPSVSNAPSSLPFASPMPRRRKLLLAVAGVAILAIGIAACCVWLAPKPKPDPGPRPIRASDVTNPRP